MNSNSKGCPNGENDSSHNSMSNHSMPGAENEATTGKRKRKSDKPRKNVSKNSFTQ